MTAPAWPIIIQPDAEAWVWANVQTIPGCTVFEYATVHDHIPWVVAHSIQIDVRAKTKQAARDNAELARQTMARLPAVAWADGVISYVQPVEGPIWLPDIDGGPRYVARYEVRAHPPRIVP